MSSEKKETNQKKDVKKRLGQVNYLNVIAVIYALYMAYQFLSALFTGAGREQWAVYAGGGAVFLLGALWLLRREWRNFNRTEADEEFEGTAQVKAETPEGEEAYDALPEEFMMTEGFAPPEGFVPPQTEEKNNKTE